MTVLSFTIDAEVERVQGKFASREDLEAVQEWLENANEGQIDGVGADGDSEYEVTNWEVAPVEQPKRQRKPKAAKA